MMNGEEEDSKNKEQHPVVEEGASSPVTDEPALFDTVHEDEGENQNSKGNNNNNDNWRRYSLVAIIVGLVLVIAGIVLGLYIPSSSSTDNNNKNVVDNSNDGTTTEPPTESPMTETLIISPPETATDPPTSTPSTTIATNTGNPTAATTTIPTVLLPLPSVTPTSTATTYTPTGTGTTSPSSTPTMSLDNGSCNNDIDLHIWMDRGGIDNRRFDVTYCSRDYNGGCLLDADCLMECYQQEFGYTFDCSTCFANINLCVASESHCLNVCAGNPIGELCQSCLIDTHCDLQFYNCSGLPDDDDDDDDIDDGACNDNDEQIWVDLDGLDGLHEVNSYCVLEYTNDSDGIFGLDDGCFENDAECHQECVETTYGYSPDCSICFANLIPCYIQKGCIDDCAGDVTGFACRDCAALCVDDAEEIFWDCTGFDREDVVVKDVCDDLDEHIWIDQGGLDGRDDVASYCALYFNVNGVNGCLADVGCIQECVESFGYSTDCSVCFANLSPCTIEAGCLGFCAVDSTSAACRDCLALAACDELFFECTGFVQPEDVDTGAPSPVQTTE